MLFLILNIMKVTIQKCISATKTYFKLFYLTSYRKFLNFLFYTYFLECLEIFFYYFTISFLMTEEIELNPLSLERTKSRQMPKNMRRQLTHELIKRNTMITNQNETRLKTSPFSHLLQKKLTMEVGSLLQG